MKKITYISIALLSFLTLYSCESWLDVAPRAEIKEDSQFSNEQGFKDALYGVYTKATATAMYGDHLTMGFLSALTSSYSNHGSSTAKFYYAGRYDYANSTVKSWINAIWNETYSTIAQINLILKNVDKNQGVMSEQTYKMVKGEMLGLRAWLHFDLFRLYAPAYTSGTDLTTLSIPYMDEYTIVAKEPLPMNTFIDRVLKDLSEAKPLLASYNTIDLLNSYLNASVSSGAVGDNFVLYRQNRFNYYAARGLEARIYLYTGKKTEAAQAAQEVIGSQKFHFITATEANVTGTGRDYVFTPELIFALYDSNLKNRSDNYFSELTSTTATNKLQLTTARIGTLYEITLGGSSDTRYVKQWAASGANTYCTKYWQLETTSMALRNQIPLLKLSEMYLILAEATNDPAPLNTFREARALNPNITTTTLDAEIEKEYQKDFFAEGQTFFYYKRMGTVRVPNSSVNAVYVLPIPDEEVTYGKL